MEVIMESLLIQFQVNGLTAESTNIPTYSPNLQVFSLKRIFARPTSHSNLLWSFSSTEQDNREHDEKSRPFHSTCSGLYLKMYKKLASVTRLTIWLLGRQANILILNKCDFFPRLNVNEGNEGYQ